MRETTLALIDRLAESAVGLPYSVDKVCNLLSEIGEAGDTMAVIGVYPLLCSELNLIVTSLTPGGLGGVLVRLNLTTERTCYTVPEEVRSAAVVCISRLISAVHIEKLPEIDTKLRLYNSWWGVSPRWSAWATPAPPDPSTVQGLPGASLAIGALSTARSGFVREAAVRQLCMRTSNEGFPFLLWRATDWVQEVRVLANTAVLERLADVRYLPDFANALPLLNRMEKMERLDLSYLTSLVRSRLLEEPGRASLVTGLQSRNMHVRRACADVLGRVQPVPEIGVIKQVAAHQDIILRHRAMEWEARLRTVDPDAAQALRWKFINDKSSGLRVAALRAEVEVDGPGLLELLWRCTSDDAVAVRECARYHIRRLVGNVDFAQHYRKIIEQDEACLHAAISGLGETGTPPDYDIVCQYLNGPRRQKACALKAMARLGPIRVRSAAIALLFDDSGPIRSIALDIAGSHISDNEADVSIAHLTKNTAHGVMTSLVIATNRMEQWKALDVLLSAAYVVPSTDVSIEAIEKWGTEKFNIYYRPRHLRAVEQDKFRDKLAAIVNRLTVTTVERLTMDIEGRLRWHR